MSRFVRTTETRTLTLANGDTLTVRARLSAGEMRAQMARTFTANGNGTLSRTPLMAAPSMIAAYLLDWNLRDDAGHLVEIRDLPPMQLIAVLDSLDLDSFQEIKDAIEAHEQAMAAERDAEKKATAGERAS